MASLDNEQDIKGTQSEDGMQRNQKNKSRGECSLDTVDILDLNDESLDDECCWLRESHKPVSTQNISPYKWLREEFEDPAARNQQMSETLRWASMSLNGRRKSYPMSLYAQSVCIDESLAHADSMESSRAASGTVAGTAMGTVAGKAVGTVADTAVGTVAGTAVGLLADTGTGSVTESIDVDGKSTPMCNGGYEINSFTFTRKRRSSRRLNMKHTNNVAVCDEDAKPEDTLIDDVRNGCKIRGLRSSAGTGHDEDIEDFSSAAQYVENSLDCVSRSLLENDENLIKKRLMPSLPGTAPITEPKDKVSVDHASPIGDCETDHTEFNAVSGLSSIGRMSLSCTEADSSSNPGVRGKAVMRSQSDVMRRPAVLRRVAACDVECSRGVDVRNSMTPPLNSAQSLAEASTQQISISSNQSVINRNQPIRRSRRGERRRTDISFVDPNINRPMKIRSESYTLLSIVSSDNRVVDIPLDQDNSVFDQVETHLEHESLQGIDSNYSAQHIETLGAEESKESTTGMENGETSTVCNVNVIGTYSSAVQKEQPKPSAKDDSDNRVIHGSETCLLRDKSSFMICDNSTADTTGDLLKQVSQSLISIAVAQSMEEKLGSEAGARPVGLVRAMNCYTLDTQDSAELSKVCVEANNNQCSVEQCQATQGSITAHTTLSDVSLLDRRTVMVADSSEHDVKSRDECSAAACNLTSGSSRRRGIMKRSSRHEAFTDVESDCNSARRETCDEGRNYSPTSTAESNTNQGDIVQMHKHSSCDNEVKDQVYQLGYVDVEGGSRLDVLSHEQNCVSKEQSVSGNSERESGVGVSRLIQPSPRRSLMRAPSAGRSHYSGASQREGSLSPVKGFKPVHHEPVTPRVEAKTKVVLRPPSTNLPGNASREKACVPPTKQPLRSVSGLREPRPVSTVRSEGVTASVQRSRSTVGSRAQYGNTSLTLSTAGTQAPARLPEKQFNGAQSNGSVRESDVSALRSRLVKPVNRSVSCSAASRSVVPAAPVPRTTQAGKQTAQVRPEPTVRRSNTTALYPPARPSSVAAPVSSVTLSKPTGTPSKPPGTLNKPPGTPSLLRRPASVVRSRTDSGVTGTLNTNRPTIRDKSVPSRPRTSLSVYEPSSDTVELSRTSNVTATVLRAVPVDRRSGIPGPARKQLPSIPRASSTVGRRQSSML